MFKQVRSSAIFLTASSLRAFGFVPVFIWHQQDVNFVASDGEADYLAHLEADLTKLLSEKRTTPASGINPFGEEGNYLLRRDHGWEMVNLKAYDQISPGTVVCRDLNRSKLKRNMQFLKNLGRSKSKLLNDTMLGPVLLGSAALFKPDRHLVHHVGESTLLKLNEQQCRALKMMCSSNPVVFVSAAYGTGKTSLLLAAVVEKVNSGRKVLFVTSRMQWPIVILPVTERNLKVTAVLGPKAPEVPAIHPETVQIAVSTLDSLHRLSIWCRRNFGR